MKPSLLLLLPLLVLALSSCGDLPEPGETAEASGHAESEADFERGPHRGRLLRDGDFALEVTIFETGVSPEFRLYAFLDGKPLPPGEVRASIELSRLDGEVNRFQFAAQGDVLVGDGTVTEPHSFDVVVLAEHAGSSHRWAFASHEGRTSMPPAVAAAAGVRTEVAGPATIHERVRLMGRVTMDANRFAEVRSRFAGAVREVRVGLGDAVKAGQTLALVENRDSLRTFAVTSPLTGVVLARHTNVGDVAGDGPLFEIADLSIVWVELNAFGLDAAKLAPGQTIRVRATVGAQSADSTLDRLLPLASAASQTVVARASLPNPNGEWRPGMAVQAEVTIGSREVPLAVKRSALQRFRDFTVVFAQIGESYEVRMLELGEQDADQVEVLEGLKAGTRYVTEQSFLIKADIEKSGAGHDH